MSSLRSSGALIPFTIAILVSACGESQHATPSDEPDGGAHAGQLRVLDAMQAPAPAVRALVNGTVVTTDEHGLAMLPPELPAEYDVSVFSGPSDYTFVGLKTRSPDVVLTNQYLSPQAMGANFKLVYPSNLGAERRVLFTLGVSGAGVEHASYAYNSDASSLFASVTWIGPASATVSAEAFLVDRDQKTHAVTGYEGYAVMAWPEAGGTDITWTPEFGALPFDLTSVEIDVELPPGATVDFDTLDVVEPNGRTGSIAFGSGAATNVVVPNVPGASYEVDSVIDEDGGGFVAEAHQVAPGAVTHAQALDAPSAVAPADEASGVTLDTEFTWSAPEGAVYYLFAFTTDDGPYLDYTIATTVPSGRLPDLALLGLAFPAGRKFNWMVHTEYGLSSLDSYAAGEPSTGWGYSGTRSFQTAEP